MLEELTEYIKQAEQGIAKISKSVTKLADYSWGDTKFDPTDKFWEDPLYALQEKFGDRSSRAISFYNNKKVITQKDVESSKRTFDKILVDYDVAVNKLADELRRKWSEANKAYIDATWDSESYSPAKKKELMAARDAAERAYSNIEKKRNYFRKTFLETNMRTIPKRLQERVEGYQMPPVTLRE